jgi:regulator of protease activity HflC (stomatin/prohibitin superfamily)
MNKGFIGAIIAGVLVFGGAIGAVSCLERIPAGYVGVIYNMNGGIENNVLTQGWKFVPPNKHVTTYSVATEQAFLSKDGKEGNKDDDSFGIPTSDGKLLNVDLEFSYHFDSDKLPVTFSKFKGQSGKTIEDTFIRAKMKSWSGEVSSKFTVLEIYGEKRAELNKAVLDHVSKNFAEYGIVIDSVNFSRIGIDDATGKAIQDRVNAQQQLETLKIEKEKAQVEADRKKIEAQGNADATLITAKGQAQANKELQQSLTPELIQSKMIDKWNGTLPSVQGSSTPIIQLPTTGK